MQHTGTARRLATQQVGYDHTKKINMHRNQGKNYQGVGSSIDPLSGAVAEPLWKSDKMGLWVGLGQFTAKTV